MLGLPPALCDVGNPFRSTIPLCGFILYVAIVLENISCGYFHRSLVMEIGCRELRSALSFLLFFSVVGCAWPSLFC